MSIFNVLETIVTLFKSDIFKSDIEHICVKLRSARKGVPELRGPALVCLSALDKKIGLLFCKHSCIGFPHGPES